MESFVTVYRSLDAMEAELLADVLDQEGIPVRHLGTRHGALIGAGQHILEQRLEVDPAFETRARALIGEVLDAPDHDANPGHDDTSNLADNLEANPLEPRNKAQASLDREGSLRGLSPMIALGAALVIPGGSHFYGRRPWAGWLIAASLLTLFVGLVVTDWGAHSLRIAAGMMLGCLWFADVAGGQVAVRAYNQGAFAEWWRQLLIPVAAIAVGAPVAMWLAPRVPIAPPPDYGRGDVVIMHEPGYGDPFSGDPIGADSGILDPYSLDPLGRLLPAPDPAFGVADDPGPPAMEATTPDLVFDWGAAIDNAPFDIQPEAWSVTGSHHMVVMGPSVHSRGVTWWIPDDMLRRFATDNDLLVVRTDDATRIYAASGEILHALDPGLYPVKAIPGGRFLAVQWSVVRVLDAQTGLELVQLEDGPEYAENLIPSGDGEWLAGLDANRRLLLWNTRSGRPTAPMVDLEIREIRPAADGFALRIDDTWHHWVWEEEHWVTRRRLSPESTRSQIVSMDGSRLLVVDLDGMETIVDPIDGRVIRAIQPNGPTVYFTQRRFLSATRIAYVMSNDQVWMFDL